jgi:hypothetical protein
MCQWSMRSRFDRAENRQIRKVASLSAQALSIQSLNFNAFARARCHDHLVFADINANVIRSGLLTAWHIKVNYIPRLHLAWVYPRTYLT